MLVFFHLGTSFSLLLYFAKDWLKLIKDGLRLFKHKNLSPEGRVFWLILVATLPGAILGGIWGKKVEGLFYRPLTIAINLGGFGLLFYLIEKISKVNKTIKEINLPQALFIGTAQALAIIPGISRSAITIASGLLIGLDRKNAVRFSFLLSLPIILGAGLLKIKEIQEGFNFSANSLAFISSFLSGLYAINFLTQFVAHHSFKPFIIYRVLISLLILIIILV